MPLLLLALLAAALAPGPASTDDPVRVAVVGLTHTHVHWILGREDRGDIEIVGIYEPNRELALRYSDQHGYPMNIVWDDLEEMLDKVRPEAVTAFNPIVDHLATVEAAAPRGIHVMVEKPLAVSMDHARRMAELAKQHDILLLTNYETTWYPSTARVFDWAGTTGSGPIRRMIARDGHFGPREIGVNEEFLEWLTDPVANGGGALTDFGCYGANLMIGLMGGQKPTTVTAITQQIKPDVYPDVDDDATILLTWPGAQGIIQASWNWPVHRKDLQVYTAQGMAMAHDGEHLSFSEAFGERTWDESAREAPYSDPFAYLAARVRGTAPDDGGLSSLRNNLLVTEILDAARRSAAEGRTIELDP